MINKKFLQLAKEVSKNSPDPSTKVGAVIVNSEQKVVSTGFNDFPVYCNKNDMVFERPMKYHLIMHAEMKALLNAKESVKDCVLYVTHKPCDNCLKHLIEAGIKAIYFDKQDTNGKMFNEEINEAINILQKSSNILIKKLDN